MDDLIAFLRARLDEREAAARAVDGETGDGWWTGAGLSDPDTWNLPKADAAFIADNSPKFVLDDVAAKRKLMAGHGPGPVRVDEDGEEFQLCVYHEWQSYPCPTLRLLALPHAGHPDYRDEWRP